jgi:hypothetical protein
MQLLCPILWNNKGRTWQAVLLIAGGAFVTGATIEASDIVNDVLSKD